VSTCAPLLHVLVFLQCPQIHRLRFRKRNFQWPGRHHPWAGARRRVFELLAFRGAAGCSTLDRNITLHLPLVAAVCISDSGATFPLAFNFYPSKSHMFPLIRGRKITPGPNLTVVDRSPKLLSHASCSRSGSGSISLTALFFSIINLLTLCQNLLNLNALLSMLKSHGIHASFGPSSCY
jgi:hypothetical protein